MLWLRFGLFDRAFFADRDIADTVGLVVHLEMPPNQRPGERLDVQHDFAVLEKTHRAGRLTHDDGESNFSAGGRSDFRPRIV